MAAVALGHPRVIIIYEGASLPPPKPRQTAFNVTSTNAGLNSTLFYHRTHMSSRVRYFWD